MYQRENRPEDLVERARLCESLGYDDIWVVEDLMFAGGIAQASTALMATDRIRVGIGILPAMARNPTYAAMELATLGRLYPNRTYAGIGHGMQDWMRQVGASPASPLGALEETIIIIRGLLAGDAVTLQGDSVEADRIQLEHPPSSALPVLAGVRGPRSMTMVGRVADGAILAEPTSAAYTAWAREHLMRERSPGADPPMLVTYSWLSVDSDAERALKRIRPMLASIPGGLAEPSVRAQLLPLPFSTALLEAVDESEDQTALAGRLQPEWMSELAIVGTPADCARSVEKRREAGADSIVLVPLPGLGEQQIRAFAEEVLPLLGE